jgi:hypothetical protein
MDIVKDDVKWPKDIQNDQGWLKIAKSGEKWPKRVNNGQRQSKISDDIRALWL